MSKASNQNLRVGLFIFGLVVLGATMLFFVGGASKLLEERYVLNAYFKDVGGLKPGAIVRLSGLDVGEILSRPKKVWIFLPSLSVFDEILSYSRGIKQSFV